MHEVTGLLTGASRFALVPGDAAGVLPRLPEACVAACMTSPPYWGQRRYAGDSSLGTEPDWHDYVARLVRIMREVARVLRPDGSLWLNIGDTYDRKALQGIPWRVAFALMDDGWIVRNEIVWDKAKGNPCHARDKLRNVHEQIFHFVRQPRYHYDADAVRNPAGQPVFRNGRVVTPTGVSGLKYEKQIHASRELSAPEKAAALEALHESLRKVAAGSMPDFRMILRGTQRATHSDSAQVSGRAGELAARGFCILPYHRNGAKPGDVWRVIPADEWRTDGHYAVFPPELCTIPIKTTCPPGEILLDPFAGTGSALVAAVRLGRRGLGIDTGATYLDVARRRLARETAGLSLGA